MSRSSIARVLFLIIASTFVLVAQGSTKCRMASSTKEDGEGEPDGSITRESGTVARIADMISPATQAEKEKLILETQKQQLALGLTSIRDLQLAPDFMRTYFEMWGGQAAPAHHRGPSSNPSDMESLEDILKPFPAA